MPSSDEIRKLLHELHRSMGSAFEPPHYQAVRRLIFEIANRSVLPSTLSELAVLATGSSLSDGDAL